MPKRASTPPPQRFVTILLSETDEPIAASYGFRVNGALHPSCELRDVRAMTPSEILTMAPKEFLALPKAPVAEKVPSF